MLRHGGTDRPAKGRHQPQDRTALVHDPRTPRPAAPVLAIQLAIAWLWLPLFARLMDRDGLWATTNADDTPEEIRSAGWVAGFEAVRPLPTQAPHQPDVAFFVPGTPAAQGNKQAFRNKYSGKVALVERTAGNPHWRQDVRDAFDRIRRPSQEPLTGPLDVSLRFVFGRPKSHYNAKGVVKPTAPRFHTSRPDADKLQRALLDAIQVPTGGSVIADDALVAQVTATKEYGERPGVFVEVRRLK